MTAAFIAGMREALEAGLLIILLLQYPLVRDHGAWLVSGVIVSAIAGAGLNLSGPSLEIELWSKLRHISECALYFSGVALMALSAEARYKGNRLWQLGFLGFGLMLTFFEFRMLGFYLIDSGREHGRPMAPLLAGGAGVLLAAGLCVYLHRKLRALEIHRLFSLPSLLIFATAMKITLGGLKEMEPVALTVRLEAGIRSFTSHAIAALRSGLMLDAYPMLISDWAGLFDYLAGDRLSTAILVLIVTAPPVLVLAQVFSAPDPDIRDLRLPAERRLRIAGFRREMVFLAAPMVVAFFAIMFMIHAGNVSVNPWTEPEPIPVQEAEAAPGEIHIPMADRLGEFTDGKLRKYIFYKGNRRIIFLAMMKPDQSIGVALDECEICNPAEWNKDAWGYAQQGANLVCKYCITPIPVSTLNEPGGCNPIPIPFIVREGTIVISTEEMVKVFDKLRYMDKRGTHF